MAPFNPKCWSFNLDMTEAEIKADHISPTSSVYLELQHLCTGCFVMNGFTKALWLLSLLLYFSVSFSLSSYLSLPQRDAHTSFWWVKVFGASPHWWAVPETLAASLWLSRSCWQRAGWEDCNDSFLATSSWDAPLSRRCCYLVKQFCNIKLLG